MSSDSLLAYILGEVNRYIYFDDGGFTFNLKSILGCQEICHNYPEKLQCFSKTRSTGKTPRSSLQWCVPKSLHVFKLLIAQVNFFEH